MAQQSQARKKEATLRTNQRNIKKIRKRKITTTVVTAPARQALRAAAAMATSLAVTMARSSLCGRDVALSSVLANSGRKRVRTNAAFVSRTTLARILASTGLTMRATSITTRLLRRANTTTLLRLLRIPGPSTRVDTTESSALSASTMSLKMPRSVWHLGSLSAVNALS